MLSGGDFLTENKYKLLGSFLNNSCQTEDADYWQDWHRFSSRQQRKIPMGGLLGISLVTPPIGFEQLWWKWWKVAEIFHFGKGTTMGQGRIQIS